MQDWQNDLDIVSDLPLDGVDLYALNLLPSTPLGKAVENKRVTLPDVTQRRDFYLTGEAFLADEGWRQLSNSHWARTTRERNLYNLLIKQGADCLAFGSCAGGNIDGQSYMMERSLERYYQKLDEGRKPIMMMTSRSEQHRWRLALQGGIEVGHFDLKRVLPDPLMQVNGTRFRLTPAGRFWASNLMQALQTLVPQLLETKQPILEPTA
ncbi:MAG: heme anaerobic degradation radical SAM methyltransferase ChuW/HutW, partial [Hafnia sp.]